MATAWRMLGATRMLHDGRHKLIWYPAGNSFQLFDLVDDPNERIDRAADPDYQATRESMQSQLVERLYGADIDQGWVVDGKFSRASRRRPSKPSPTAASPASAASISPSRPGGGPGPNGRLPQ